MIYHAISGSEDKIISPKYTKEINNNITKMMFTYIIIRIDEDRIMYKSLKNFFYDSAILPVERVTANLNGNEVACIHLLAKLPLYIYANNKNQIARINLVIVIQSRQEFRNYFVLNLTINLNVGFVENSSYME